MSNDRTARNMTQWYVPLELLRTGLQVAASKVISSRADARVLESLTDPQQGFDHSNSDELVLDFVADTGDGFNSAFAVAKVGAELNLEGVPPDSDVVVMGGDQVYPVATREGYKDRFELPYEMAYGDKEKKPTLYAIPGNHDWYDGLVHFRRLFCQKRLVGSLPSEQTRSYFSLKLPGNWWLFGVDVQLGYDVDRPQLKYFREEALAKMRAGDRVILCVSDPIWVYDDVNESNLRYLERLVEEAGGCVCLWLAGDLHYYRHHGNDEAELHKVVSGGGGAFLHATHPNKQKSIVVEQTNQTVTLDEKDSRFPSEDDSKCLSWRALLFPILNPWFGSVTSIVYLALSWVLYSVLGELPLSFENVGEFLYSAAHTIAFSPGGVVTSAALFVFLYAFSYFGDGNAKLLRGILHTTGHLGAAALAGWVIVRCVPGSAAAHMLISLAAGWLVGAFVFGAYLFVAVRFMGSHANEAFSAIRVQDYKNFLRIHVKEDGSLTVYPIGINKVPKLKKWWKPLDLNDPEIKGSQATPHLIENPIKFRAKDD